MKNPWAREDTNEGLTPQDQVEAVGILFNQELSMLCLKYLNEASKKDRASTQAVLILILAKAVGFMSWSAWGKDLEEEILSVMRNSATTLKDKFDARDKQPEPDELQIFPR